MATYTCFLFVSSRPSIDYARQDDDRPSDFDRNGPGDRHRTLTADMPVSEYYLPPRGFARLLMAYRPCSVIYTVFAIVMKRQSFFKRCIDRESNPGLYRGRVLFYH